MAIRKRLGPMWPIDFRELTRIGDPVLPDRFGRPHKGRDLHAKAGTRVVAAVAGKVLQVRKPKDPKALRFVDVLGVDGKVYRYLHLWEIPDSLKEGGKVSAGDLIGTVAATGTSGVFDSTPHLHFEIRDGEFDRSRGEKGDYGPPIEPLTLLQRFPANKRA
jgi:murein DD-endopeptidase MepM/ murein hydrolase activator NlpD